MEKRTLSETDSSLVPGQLIFDVEKNDIGLVQQDGTVETFYDLVKKRLKDNILDIVPGEADVTRKIYGIKINLDNSDPDLCCEYTEDAFGMNPMTTDLNNTDADTNWINQGDWNDTLIQKIFGVRPCVLTWNPDVDNETYVEGYLDPNDYTKWINGTNSNVDAYESSTFNRNIMIEFDKIYMYTKVDNDKRVAYIKFSRTKHGDEWKVHPAFVKYIGGGVTGLKEVEHIYVCASDCGYTSRDQMGYSGTNPVFVTGLHHIGAYDFSKFNSAIIKQGYATSKNTNNSYQPIEYTTTDLLLNILRLLFKRYNLNSILLFGFTKEQQTANTHSDIVNTFNKYNAFLSCNTSYKTCKKGLFYKGTIDRAIIYDTNEDAHNASTDEAYTSKLKLQLFENKNICTCKLLGIDRLFMSAFTYIVGLHVSDKVSPTTDDSGNIIFSHLECNYFPPYYGYSNDVTQELVSPYNTKNENNFLSSNRFQLIPTYKSKGADLIFHLYDPNYPNYHRSIGPIGDRMSIQKIAKSQINALWNENNSEQTDTGSLYTSRFFYSSNKVGAIHFQYK